MSNENKSNPTINWAEAPKGTTGAMVSDWDHPDGFGCARFIPSQGIRREYHEAEGKWVYHELPEGVEVGLIEPSAKQKEDLEISLIKQIVRGYAHAGPEVTARALYCSHGYRRQGVKI